MKKKNKGNFIFGPGDTIKREIEAYGLGPEDLAHILGLEISLINQLLRNEVFISLNLAHRLSKLFKQPPEYWLDLDSSFRGNIVNSG